MIKIVSVLLLATMFVGCGDSATNEAPVVTEEAVDSEEVPAAPAE